LRAKTNVARSQRKPLGALSVVREQGSFALAPNTLGHFGGVVCPSGIAPDVDQALTFDRREKSLGSKHRKLVETWSLFVAAREVETKWPTASLAIVAVAAAKLEQALLPSGFLALELPRIEVL
jgi:hypothetical protein